MTDLLPPAIPSPHGPTCPEPQTDMDACVHPSCMHVWMEQAVAECPLSHGEQAILADHSNGGFTGAGIVVLDLACGHQYVDLSADTLEAVR